MNSHSNTIEVQKGAGASGLVALVDANVNYEMSGVGTATRLSLNGSYPARDHTGAVASGNLQNQVTLTVDAVDANRATGTVSGKFDGSSGFRCTIDGGGTAELTR
jgi:hypothetical protein